MWPADIFRRVRIIAKSDYELRHFRPSVRIEQLGCHWTDFHVILFEYFLKIRRKKNFQVLLKSEKNNEHFT